MAPPKIFCLLTQRFLGFASFFTPTVCFAFCCLPLCSHEFVSCIFFLSSSICPVEPNQTQYRTVQYSTGQQYHQCENEDLNSQCIIKKATSNTPHQGRSLVVVLSFAIFCWCLDLLCFGKFACRLCRFRDFIHGFDGGLFGCVSIMMMTSKEAPPAEEADPSTDAAADALEKLDVGK